MDRSTTLGSTTATDERASHHSPRRVRNRGVRSMKRVMLLAAIVAAGAISVHPSPTLADVSSGSSSGAGSAVEWVNCNSSTHTITITTMSTGIPSDQNGGILFYYPLTYRVWLKMQGYVNGAWQAPTNWLQFTDGTHKVQFPETAGATSYWYFTWAFEQPNGTIATVGEWAGGLGSYGWYSDQRGFTGLLSCRT